jgi:putative flippase GtrA
MSSDDTQERVTITMEIPPNSADSDQYAKPLAVQHSVVSKQWMQWLVNLFPGGQFVRYLCVGGFNTFFGYFSFAIILTLLNAVVSARLLYITVVLASALSMPLNITVSYLGYKVFVFRTQGNYLREWLKCFAVYGTAMIPSLFALSALTRYLQSVIRGHAVWLHGMLTALEGHLSGRPLALLERVATGRAMAGYIAGAIVIGFTTIYSFIAHKKVTFHRKTA